MTRLAAARLGLSPREADLLSAQALAKLGRYKYGGRAVAFALATTPLVRSAIPRSLRRRAIKPFLYALMPGHPEILLYVDLPRSANDG